MPKIPKCPTHHVFLGSSETKFGTRWKCRHPGCTMACWNGETSTPADDETRASRSRCHEVFDSLWKGRRRFQSRRKAYQWMMTAMGLPKSKAHIGMFSKEQCNRLMELVEAESA